MSHDPTYDIWRRKEISFRGIAAVQAALRDPLLLSSYFDRVAEVLKMIEANSSTAGFDTDLAWDVVHRRTATVLMYGESGSGKSTLVRALTADESVTTSAAGVGTHSERAIRLPCGMCFIDTPGFRVPLSSSGEQSGDDIGGSLPAVTSSAQAPQEFGSWLSPSWIKEVFVWRKMLFDLSRRLTSGDAASRPLALVYVHRGSSRIVAERMAELLKMPHDNLVPVFLVLSDVCSMDDRDLATVRTALHDVIGSVGANRRGRMVQLVEVNSQSKRVRGHMHPQCGIRELVGGILNALDPIDVLTFTSNTLRGAVFGGKRGKGGAKTEARAEDDAENDDEDEEQLEEEDEEGGGSGGSAAGIVRGTTGKKRRASALSAKREKPKPKGKSRAQAKRQRRSK